MSSSALYPSALLRGTRLFLEDSDTPLTDFSCPDFTEGQNTMTATRFRKLWNAFRGVETDDLFKAASDKTENVDVEEILDVLEVTLNGFWADPEVADKGWQILETLRPEKHGKNKKRKVA